MKITPPYLLFTGDATDPLSIKMARSAADWCPEHCVGEFALPGCTVTTGLPQMDIHQAAAKGTKSFVLGFANSGGTLNPAWIPGILLALEQGMDIISGLHDKLTDIDVIRIKAQELGRQLIDIRHPTTRFKTGVAAPRSGKRLLTVGTDCSVGKMYTSLSLVAEMKKRHMDVSFQATGQCGILISGDGVAIDCVVADFISGAAESLSPDASELHWDVIEGQGSLSHPAFAGVSLGLLHGSQPDALVICHALGRTHMRGLPHQPFPSVADTINKNLDAARLTNAEAYIAGIAVNTSAVSESEALEICLALSDEFSVPCVDPLRHGTGPIIEGLK